MELHDKEVHVPQQEMSQVRVKRLQNFVNVYTECNKRNATV